MLVDINLLPQKERDRPAVLIAAISILLLAVILWAVLFFMARGEAAEHEDLTAQSAEVALQQAAIREQLEASQGLNEEQQLQVTVDWAESYEYDTIPLLAELVSHLPERGFFNSFSYIGPNSASLAIQFDTSRDAAYYLTHLKDSELLESVTLDSVTTAEVPNASDEEVVEEGMVENPRYLATYSITFVDDRIPTEGEAEADDGTAVEEEAAEEPAEVETEEEPDVETDVDVNVETETDTTPEETEGEVNE
ncbi:PilN domain-containing protein [Planococcus salinus]|uniref:Fimbrial assembly protein n=1 Tax=Planococcus salinus TaxID=1848460 RepID=A0A3M8PB66_9BACL|nr:fimbrial assembly protein [Planococcus salinus]RNF40935.1 fimbrial assembly protein [Planococcus salinus]